MSQEEIIEEPKKSWITITVAGMTIGMTVAAATYVAASMTANAAATVSGFTIDMIGQAAGLGTSYLLGPASGYGVKLATNAFAKTAEASVKHSGVITAGVLSAAAGTATALSITAGTRFFEYSIEYGGKLSKEAAIKISEAYLKYKISQLRVDESGEVGKLEDEDVDNGWLLITDTEMNENIIKEVIIE